MVREVKPTEEQIQALFDDRIFVQGLTSIDLPKAIIVAGVSGSGKSTCIKLLYDDFELNYFPIQADDYRRIHPKISQYIEKYGRDNAHKKTGNFAHRVAKGLLKKATENRLNIIYETTFNNVDTATELLSELKEQNYQIHILALPSNTELSIMRNRQRFEDKRNIEGTLPRIVEREVIERMAINYQQCLEQLKQDKNIHLYQIKDNQEVNSIVQSILQNNR